MDEAAFLETYDPAAFERPSVAVDLILMSVVDGTPAVLLTRRDRHPFQGNWALPGGFAEPGEAIEVTAARELFEETHVAGVAPELVGVFSAPGRDPRGWVVSVLFTALVDAKPQAKAGDDAREAAWFDVEALPAPAFDHAEMIRAAMAQVLTK